MRLSTDPNRDDHRSVAVLRAALDAGVTLLDTADAYCRDDCETGHNERLVARALAAWPGDRSRVRVATKGGLVRPNGGWMPDGRARHIAEACEASLRALGVPRIDLYQLHAVDPRVPLATTLRAFAALKREGLVEHVGLCNVTVGQIEAARRIVDVDAVQIELSLSHDDNILSGVAAYCIANGIELLAYRPFGGSQRARRLEADPVLGEIAAAHGATPSDVAIAWLLDLSHLVVPLPGPTRIETASSIASPYVVALTGGDRARLEERFAAPRALQQSRALTESAGARGPAPQVQGEVVLIMGLPGAGKSTAAQVYTARGFSRVNRDVSGGSLRGLAASLDRLIDAGHSRIVLDNTYVSRKARAPVVQAAARRGLAIRCIWLTTSVEDAQVNAVTRMIGKYGRLLGPDEMRDAVKHDVSAFGPGVPFRYQRELEPPSADEGFAGIDAVPFVRDRRSAFTNRAIVVWCDGVLGRLRMTAAQQRPDVFGDRGDVLRRYAAEGWRILGLDWQPALADDSVAVDQVDAAYRELRDRLDVDLDVLYCPHAAGPPVCWCRKPLPGLGVAFIEKHRLDAPQCIYVGAGAQDPGFARRLGFQYRDASEFFTPT
jgi:aryl-alcohol dehydrogenase-like predicted oxidoreductase